MATKRHVIPHTVFDTDLTGLYQPEQGVTILGKSLRYRAPNIPLNGLIYTFLIEVIGEMIATPEERQKITAEKLYEKVFAHFEELKKPVEDEDLLAQRQLAMGKMFLNPKANRILLEAIKLSFPDIQEPEALTDNAFIELVSFIFKQMPDQ